MAKATELKRGVKAEVNEYQCSECQQQTLVDVGAPNYCQHCGEEFEETETIEGDLIT